jgi:subtilisin family serine protease
MKTKRTMTWRDAALRGFLQTMGMAIIGLVLGASPVVHGQPIPERRPDNAVRVFSRQPTNAPVTRSKDFFRRPWGGPRQPQQLYVKFYPKTTVQQRQAAHRTAGASRVENGFGDVLPDTVLVTMPAGRERVAADSYLDNTNVIYAEPVYLAQTAAVIPNDPEWPLQWGMQRIRAEHAWDFAKWDTNFVVGVVDSGLFYDHLDLKNNVWTNPREIPGNNIDDDGNGRVDDTNGWNFYRNDASILDNGTSHGTHVSGIIAAVGDNSKRVVGVNWKCKILMAACGVPGTNTMTNTLQAFSYILTSGVRVSNHSYGGTNYSQTAYDLFLAAQRMGHIAVCAAGNDSSNNDGTPVYPASYQLDNIISVAASSLSDELALFSNYGSNSVDLAAPGFSILSTVAAFPDGTGYKDGTSMAAPHVTGAISLIWSTYPQLTWQEVRARVLTGVTESIGLQSKVASNGRLDVARSMAVVCDPGAGGGGTGVLIDPYRNFSDSLGKVPHFGQLYIKPPIQPWSWTGRIGGHPKRIAPLNGTVRIGSP